MLASALLVCLQVAAPPTDASAAVLIPEGLEISTQIVHDSNRGTFVPRLAVVWSRDGQQVAYAAVRGNEWFAVSGTEVGPAYDSVSVPVAAGGHVAFQVARRTSASKVQSWLWIDGRTLAAEDWMSDVRISASGTAIAYWTQPGALLGNSGSGREKTCFLTIARQLKDGSWKAERGERWLEAGLEPPRLSADGLRAGGPAVSTSGWVAVVRKGKRETVSATLDSINEFELSADGTASAIISGGTLYFKNRAVLQGTAGLSRLTLDPRGKHCAYAQKVGGQWTVGLDGKALPVGTYDHVLALEFDPDGRGLAIVVNQGGILDEAIPGNVLGGDWFVVQGTLEKESDWQKGPVFQRVRDLTYSEDGARLAYCAQVDDGWRAICGGSRSEPFDYVGSLAFQDESSLGFGALRGRELLWKLLGLD